MVSRSLTGNVEHDSDDNWMAENLFLKQSKNYSQNDFAVCIDDLKSQLIALQYSHLQNTPTTVHSATVAMIAGYLVFLVKENFDCNSCLSRISTAVSPSPLLALIKASDRGGRLYPKPGFINVWINVEKVTQSALPKFSKQPDVLKNLANFILPYLERNYYMVCPDAEDDGHDKEISLFLLKKFLRPYLVNAANFKTESLQTEKFQKEKKRPLKAKKLAKIVP